jgi:hypothetical protein
VRRPASPSWPAETAHAVGFYATVAVALLTRLGPGLGMLAAAALLAAVVVLLLEEGDDGGGSGYRPAPAHDEDEEHHWHVTAEEMDQ